MKSLIQVPSFAGKTEALTTWRRNRYSNAIINHQNDKMVNENRQNMVTLCVFSNSG